MGLDGNPRVPASGGPESLDTAQKWFQKSGVSAGKTESFPTSAKAEDYMRSAPPGTKFFIGKPGVNEGGHAFGARIGSDGRLIVVDPSGGNAKNMMSNPGFADKTFVIKVQ